MIVTRLALPVRSPMPLTVPCTWVAPDSTAVSVLATAQPESSWVWIPSAASGRASRTTASAVRIWGGSEPPLVSHSTSRSAPASAAARRQSSAYPASRVKAVEEVLGVEQHALADPDQIGDRLADHLQVLLARGLHDLLHVQHRGLADERADGSEAAGQHGQALVLLGGHAAAAGHPEGDDLGDLQALVGEQLEELLLLRVRDREAGLDHVHAEGVERVHDPAPSRPP